MSAAERSDVVSEPLVVDVACPPMRNFSTYDPSRHDAFIRFITSMLHHSFVLADSFAESAQGTMTQLEQFVLEHKRRPKASKLRRLVPSIGQMHTPLALGEAFSVYDAKYHVTARTHVPPSEDEVRHILNLAQTFSSSSGLKFISFDGDETLYADGRNFAQSDASKLARYIEKLLLCGIAVALVTAAGYKGAPEKYEVRLDGLLQYFRTQRTPADALARFFVVGGECNYLFECERVDGEVAAADGRCEVRLRQGPADWCEAHAAWADSEITRVLNVAESSLRATATDLALRCRVIRKDRAVGIIPGGADAKLRIPEGSGSRRVRRELLDEAALRLQAAIGDAATSLPTCCFNGGADVWCDIGNKAVGVGALQQRLGLEPSQCLHVGDQLSTSIGNDFAARQTSPTLWVAGPKETQHILKHLLERRGINPKKNERATWPPSTRKMSVFSSTQKLLECPSPQRFGEAADGSATQAFEQASQSGAGEAEEVPDWVRG